MPDFTERSEGPARRAYQTSWGLQHIELAAFATCTSIMHFFFLYCIGFHAVSWSPSSTTPLSVGIVLTASGVGTVLGALFVGHFISLYGYRTVIVLGIVLSSMASTLAMLPEGDSWGAIAVFRACVGLGVGSYNIAIICYLQRLAPRSMRFVFISSASVPIPAGLALGVLLMNSHRGPAITLLLSEVVPVVLVAWCFLLPDPRLGTRGIPTISGCIKRSVRSALRGVLSRSCSMRRVSTHEAFGIPCVKILCLALSTACFMVASTSIQSWGMAICRIIYKMPDENIQSAFMIAAAFGVCGRMLALYIYLKHGPMTVFSLFTAVGTSICFMVFLLGADRAHFIAALVLIMFFVDGLFGVINSHVVEQFPVDFSPTGLGFTYGIGALAKVFSPLCIAFATPIALEAREGAWRSVACIFFIFGMTLIAGLFFFWTSMHSHSSEGEDFHQIEPDSVPVRA